MTKVVSHTARLWFTPPTTQRQVIVTLTGSWAWAGLALNAMPTSAKTRLVTNVRVARNLERDIGEYLHNH